MAIWQIRNYQKKSVETQTFWTKGNQTIVIKTGSRWGVFKIETCDNNIPNFRYDYLPGGNEECDSVNLLECETNNIVNSNLIDLDNSAWDDFDFIGNFDSKEKNRLERLFANEYYEQVLEKEGFSIVRTDIWMWGPILIQDNRGRQVKIAIADNIGQMIDYKEVAA